MPVPVMATTIPHAQRTIRLMRRVAGRRGAIRAGSASPSCRRAAMGKVPTS
ncbi:hypothetical protein P0F65_14055 [Sphingomonas sp. I4]